MHHTRALNRLGNPSKSRPLDIGYSHTHDVGLLSVMVVLQRRRTAALIIDECETSYEKYKNAFKFTLEYSSVVIFVAGGGYTRSARAAAFFYVILHLALDGRAAMLFHVPRDPDASKLDRLSPNTRDAPELPDIIICPFWPRCL
ncbi:hypothetical protein EVAR_27320_1 [Eumeta japonica]|uniref:Uncharacterized protein n=1 Tax=Eumeta variegata TaxID=151549 RepID=A0A4C1UDR8_EUMVA|nr:hypothetical protein EVAR_27320_1 [Eumeta japonica]